MTLDFGLLEMAFSASFFFGGVALPYLNILPIQYYYVLYVLLLVCHSFCRATAQVFFFKTSAESSRSETPRESLGWRDPRTDDLATFRWVLGKHLFTDVDTLVGFESELSCSKHPNPHRTSCSRVKPNSKYKCLHESHKNHPIEGSFMFEEFIRPLKLANKIDMATFSSWFEKMFTL